MGYSPWGCKEPDTLAHSVAMVVGFEVVSKKSSEFITHSVGMLNAQGRDNIPHFLLLC